MLMKTKFGVNQNIKQCFFCAGFNQELPKYSFGFFKLSKWGRFSGLAFVWLFLKQVKSLSDVDFNLEINVSVSAAQGSGVVLSI